MHIDSDVNLRHVYVVCYYLFVVSAWKQGYMHGHGLFRWRNGEQYLGNWHGGRMHGIGTKTTPNSGSYTGVSQITCNPAHVNHHI